MSKKRRKAGSSPAKQGPSSEDCKKKKKASRCSSVISSGCTSKKPTAAGSGSVVSDVSDVEGSVENLNAAAQNAVKVKLPPLMVKHIPLNKLVSSMASIGVVAEYKLCRIGTKVILRTKTEYDRVVSFLKEAKLEFFTHDIPGDKPFRVVIRGLPNFDPKTIEAEIKDRYKLAPTAVFRMTRRDEKTKSYPDSLFLLHFKKGTVTLNALQAIRSLFSIIIRWEPYRGSRQDVTQCQRCLNFGHGTRNCHVNPRCSICAQEHATSDCPIDGAVEFKCANCNGAHQGCDKKCPKRETFKRIRKQSSSINQPGRRSGKTPIFSAEEFPPLGPSQQVQAAPQTARPLEASGDSARNRAPTPPRSWRPSTTQNTDLFTADELMEIFVNMSSALRECRSKPEQIQVLGKFIIQYGV